MWRRLKRLYPSVIVTVFLFGLIANGHWRDWTTIDYVHQFIYPTQYHFVAKIVVYYVLLFWLARLGQKDSFRIALAALVLGMMLSAWPDVRSLYEQPVPLQTGKLAPLFLWQVFFAITLLAAMATRNVDRFTRPLTSVDFASLGLLAGGYIGLKLLMVKAGIVPWLFPAYFVISILFSLVLFRLLSHPQIVARVQRRRWLWFMIATLSTISLESYLVHIQLMFWPQWQTFPFPGNILVFSIVSIALAYLVNQVAIRIQTRLP